MIDLGWLGAEPRWRALHAAIAVVVFAAGCARTDAPADFGLGAVSGIASPAAVGSVEPYVAPGRDGSVVMSWLERADSADELRFSRWSDGEWSPPGVIARSTRFFINWADFPSIVELSDGGILAHWLERSRVGRGLAYDVLTSFSADGGATWSEPDRPHQDRVPSAHGFVSLFEVDGGPAAVWLFERPLDGVPAGAHGAGVETQLHFTTFGARGAPLPDVVIDGRSCDCCQTDAAATADGPVVVYRDRTEDEIRDIVAVRLSGGAWTEPRVVHADNWHIAGCPVNGPAIAAVGRDVAVAWFTAPESEGAKVLLAFSADAADTFDPPVRIDLGDPIGRVDVLLLEDGRAVVSWIERTVTGALVLLRPVMADGTPGDVVEAGATSEQRASGFPRMARTGAGDIVLAWTVPGEEGGVRVVTVAAGPRR